MNSHTPSLTELEIGLAKLERQNRRWKRLGLLFLLIAGSGFLLAQVPRKALSAAPTQALHAATYDTLVVHRLELRDKAGKLRGVWDMGDQGPFLALAGADGTLRAWLGLAAGSPALDFYDAAGKHRAGLEVTALGSELALYDTAGKHRALLRVFGNNPSLDLLDATGMPRAALTEDGLVRP